MPLHASRERRAPFARRCKTPRSSSTRPLRRACSQSGLPPTTKDSWKLLALAVLAALAALPTRRRTRPTDRTTLGIPRLPSLTVHMQISVETLSTSNGISLKHDVFMCFGGPSERWTSTLRTLTTHTQGRQHCTERKKHNAPATITRHQMGTQTSCRRPVFRQHARKRTQEKLSNMSMTQVAARRLFHAQTMFPSASMGMKNPGLTQAYKIKSLNKHRYPLGESKKVELEEKPVGNGHFFGCLRAV